jgi:hypothetical protein
MLKDLLGDTLQGMLKAELDTEHAMGFEIIPHPEFNQLYYFSNSLIMKNKTA